MSNTSAKVKEGCEGGELWRPTRRQFIGSAGAAGLLAVLPGAFAETKAGKVRPNILLFFPDQHRHDWLQGTPGLPIKTPNLAALAARGVRFTNAVTPSPLCAPARACLAAGKEYDRCRVPNNATNYPPDQKTFYAILRDSGYHVMGCGKFDLHKATADWRLDGKHLLKEWGFSDGIDNAGKQDCVRASRKGPADPYSAYLDKLGLFGVHIEDFRKRSSSREAATAPTPLPDDAYCDNWVGRNGLELIRKAPKGMPWFLQVNFVGPHPPWDITRSMQELYQDVEFPQPNDPQGGDPQYHLAVRRNYAAMITNIDCWIGIYIDELKKLGELDNTIIAYSSDHGEMLGDHGKWGKSLPYQPSVGVPLIIAGPGVRQSLVSHVPVSTMDLAATILELAGIAGHDDMDSRSILPLLSGKTEKHRDFVLSGLGAWRLAFDGRYKVITGFDGSTEPLFFDLGTDSGENKIIRGKAGDGYDRLLRILEERTKR